MEKYEPAQVINLIAWDRANEYTVVGITPGADLPSWWNFDIDYNFNNEPGRHRIRLDNWRLPDFCLDGITGDAREYRENCTRERFHIANIILEGLSSGVTTLDIDRSCSSQFQVETSWMSYYVESNCGQSGARHCLTDPNDPWHGGSVVYVTANNRFLVDPLDVLLTANAVVEVDGPSDALPVSEYTWSLIKSLYK